MKNVEYSNSILLLFLFKYYSHVLFLFTTLEVEYPTNQIGLSVLQTVCFSHISFFQHLAHFLYTDDIKIIFCEK